MTLTQVLEKGIKDGEIINADINASAAIAGSKLNPVGLADVGIGVVSPTHPLDVHASGTEIARFQGANNARLKLRNATNNIFLAYTDSGDAFQLGTNGQNPRVHITSDGNVGISTTNPRTELDLSQGQLSFSHRTDYSIRFYNGNGNNWSSINNPSVADGNVTNHSALEFRTASGVAMHMATDKKIGINTDANGPDRLLHVSDNNNAGVVTPFRLSNVAGSAGTEVRMEFECGLDELAYIGAKHEGSDIGPLIFATASSQGAYPTEKMRVLAGGGIAFNGDTAQANALDDYEEGTFSATATATGYSGGNAIAMLDEKYTKIGRTVHINMRLQVASNLNDGDLTITGLPFSASQNSVVVFTWQDAAGFNGGRGKISGTQCVRFSGTYPTHHTGTANIIFSATYIT